MIILSGSEKQIEIKAGVSTRLTETRARQGQGKELKQPFGGDLPPFSKMLPLDASRSLGTRRGHKEECSPVGHVIINQMQTPYW